MYMHYKVVSCGLEEELRRPPETVRNFDRIFYRCELVGCENANFGHKLTFSLMIKGCVGSPEFIKQYEVVAPHINIGDVFNCDFGWRMGHDTLTLGILGLLKMKDSYLSSGEWIRPPDLIRCNGESILKLDFPPRFHCLSALMNFEAGQLVWVPNPKPNLWKRMISRFGFLAPKTV